MDYIKIGLIKKPHGIKGECKVLPLSDDYNRYKKLKGFYIEKNNDFIFYQIKSIKIATDEIIMLFDSCDTRDKAEGFRDMFLWVERKDAVPLSGWEYYSQDIIDLPVFYNDDEIGKVIQLQNFGANDLIEVKRENKESVFYPFHRDYLTVFLDKGLIIVNEYEGFFD